MRSAMLARLSPWSLLHGLDQSDGPHALRYRPGKRLALWDIVEYGGGPHRRPATSSTAPARRRPCGRVHVSSQTAPFTSETSFPYLELAFRISVVNSDTAQKGTSKY